MRTPTSINELHVGQTIHVKDGAELCPKFTSQKTLNAANREAKIEEIDADYMNEPLITVRWGEGTLNFDVLWLEEIELPD